MKTASYRWASQAAVLSLASLLICCAGYALRLAARHNLEEQHSLMERGVPYTFSDSFSTEKVTNVDIKHLLEKQFYREKVIEPAIVAEIKGSLGDAVSDMYFPEIWDLFWYLNFIRDENALYTALERSIKNHAFASSGRCVDVAKCEVKESASNVNRDNGEMLFRVFDSYYINPAIDDLKHFNGVDAQRRATDAVSLARLVDFDDNFSLTVYDKVLVIGGFLTLPTVVDGDLPSSDDLDRLLNVVDIYTEIPDPGGQPDDKRVAIYVDGIASLRKGCFSEASGIFTRGVSDTNRDAVSELFAFLALRSLAHPVIAQDNIDASDPNPLTLFIKDCESKVPLETFRAKFDEARPLMEQVHIHHKGLKSDIEYYSRRFPRSASEIIDLHAQVEASSHRDTDNLTASEAKVEKSDVLAPIFPREVQVGKMSSAGYQWPVSGTLLGPFDTATNGIDIKIGSNAVIQAVGAGIVLFAGELGGRKMILIQHASGIVSGYFDVTNLLASKGQTVESGESIGKIEVPAGALVRSLHFELRAESKPIDPIPMLP